MSFVNTTAYYTRLDQIEKSVNPRSELANWINGMNSEQKIFFLRYIAGWTTAHYYGTHYFHTSNDPIFDELVRFVIPNAQKPASAS